MKILRSILMALVGIAWIICGNQVLHSHVGEMASYKESGGDAFTGIQKCRGSDRGDW